MIDFGLSKHFKYGEVHHEAVGTPYTGWYFLERALVSKVYTACILTLIISVFSPHTQLLQRLVLKRAPCPKFLLVPVSNSDYFRILIRLFVAPMMRGATFGPSASLRSFF
jgi:hypothetical protein